MPGHKRFHQDQKVEHKYRGDLGIIASDPIDQPDGKVFYVVFWDNDGPKTADGDDLQTCRYEARRHKDKHAIERERHDGEAKRHLDR